jgi:hypothetical protein
MLGRRGRRRRRAMAPRRVFRPMVFRPMRQRRRRRRRRRIRRTRRFMFGSLIVLALAGTYTNYKFHHHDLRRIEDYYGKPAEDLTEGEIINAMRKLGIQKIDLTEQEEDDIIDSIGEED